ncbi:MAG: AraC family transcriptional regulator [Capnocytophaga sp.]|nr:AraC family transcriptional regulator [Capnocytophaga sp.]
MAIQNLKNIAESTSTLFYVEEGIFMVLGDNQSTDFEEITPEIKQNFIQFHFCTKGNALFLFHQGNYSLPLPEMQLLLLYNPQQILPVHLKLHPKSSVVSLFISIQKFHSLFSEESNCIDFLNVENKDKKYYSNGTITPQMAVILHQMQYNNIHPSMFLLYQKAKIFELLCLFFNKTNDVNTENCPFLSDEENVKKIRQAKELIIKNMLNPPSLQELADEVGITLKKLKSGFKQIYGESVYNFLFDYKMELARKWLQSGEYNINELSIKLGYSTPSHFIAAFKKKFATTPKKYLSGKE